jgi:hypothetical protein
MIKGVFAVCIATALGLATLPIEVSAKGLGSYASHAVRYHHRAFGYGLSGGLGYGPYGGLVVADQVIGGEPVGYVSTPQPLGPLIPPSFVLQCHHSEETKMVPSEDGGTREITIRRC